MKKLRILVKVGTNVLTDPQGRLDQDVITRLARQMASLKSDGHEVLLVSSGAVGAGKDRLNLNTGSDPVVQRQVYASIGQIALMEKYQQALSSWHLHAAQVLATKEDFRDRDRRPQRHGAIALAAKPVATERRSSSPDPGGKQSMAGWRVLHLPANGGGSGRAKSRETINL